MSTKQSLDALRTALEEKHPHEWKAVSAWLKTFYKYQRSWILDFSRRAIAVKSRQIGWSYSSAAAAVLWAMLGETTAIISVGEREATEVLDTATKHAEVLARLGSKWAAARRTATELVFNSGGRIISLPSTSGARGYSCNVILDEYAYHKDPKKVFDGAAGAITHGHKLRIVSTPNGVGNMFHDIWADPKRGKGFNKHRTTIHEAIAAGLAVNLEECWENATNDPRLFGQLYECSFLDNDDQFIPHEYIQRACAENTYKHFGVTYAGLDIGRKADLTVLVILRVSEDGTRWVQRIETCKRTANEDLERLVSLALNDYGARRVCVDATGIGTFPAEALSKKFGRHKVEPVGFTLDLKEDLATTVWQVMADESLKIPASDKKLQNDIASIRRIVTKAGNIRYDAPHTDEGHADRFWALALALHAATGPNKKRHELLGT